jgi:uncharacterized membrane protein YkoI
MKKNLSSLSGMALALALVFLGVGAHKSALAANQPEQQAGAGQNVQVEHSGFTASIKVPEPEPKDLTSLAKIKPDQAMASAQAAYPGVAVKKMELDNENGWLIYSVELSNGMEMLVDAGNGVVLKKETAAAEEHEGHEKGEKED